MALIKKNELKQLTQVQIDGKIAELRKDLIKLNAQRAVGTTIESPGRIKLIKRTIARLITFKKLNSLAKNVVAKKEVAKEIKPKMEKKPAETKSKSQISKKTVKEVKKLNE